MAFVLCACGAKNQIKTNAEQAAVSMTKVQATTGEVITNLEGAARSHQNAVVSIDTAVSALGDAPAEWLAAPLADARAQIKQADTQVKEAITGVSSIRVEAQTATTNVSKIPDLLKDVENKESGFVAWLKRAFRILVVLGVTAAIVTALFLGKQYGLDKITNPIVSFLTLPFRWLSAKLDQKWEGVAKLAQEAAEGKTSTRELVAALRGSVGGIDRHMKKKHDNESK